MTHQTCFQTWHQQFLANSEHLHSNSQSILQTLHPHSPTVHHSDLHQFQSTQSTIVTLELLPGILTFVVTLLDQVSWLYSDMLWLTRYISISTGIEQHFSGYPWLWTSRFHLHRDTPIVNTLWNFRTLLRNPRQSPRLLKPSFCWYNPGNWEQPLAVVQCTRTNWCLNPFQLWIPQDHLPMSIYSLLQTSQCFQPFQSTSNSNPIQTTSLVVDVGTSTFRGVATLPSQSIFDPQFIWHCPSSTLPS